MTKRLTEIIILALVACALLVSYGVATKVEGNTYSLAAVIVGVDKDSDIVTCEDTKGNLWEFYGAKGWTVGDYTTLLMNDHGTSEVYDDVIEGACHKDTHRHNATH